MAVEVLKNPGPFHKLIGTEQEEHYFYRELKDKGYKKSQWNSVAPHVYGVADKAEFAVTTCSEDTGDKAGIDCSSHNVVGADKEHIPDGIDKVQD